MSRHKQAILLHQPLLPDWVALPLNDFLVSLRTRGCAAATIQRRRDALLLFCDFLYDSGLPRFQELTLEHLDAYRLRLIDRQYSRHTIFVALVSLRLFYRFLEAAALVFESPLAGFTLRKPPRNPPFVLTHDQVTKLLNTPDPQTPYGQRDRALLELLYSGGLRLSEAAALTLHDLELDRQIVTVLGKGNKQRLVPIGKHAVAALRLYLQDGRNFFLHGRPDPGHLWLGRTNVQQLSALSIRMTLRQHMTAAGLPKQADIHTLRRTCATHMLQGGAHPVAVAALLGHADLNSLSHYLKVNPRDLQKTHADSKPGQ